MNKDTEKIICDECGWDGKESELLHLRKGKMVYGHCVCPRCKYEFKD